MDKLRALVLRAVPTTAEARLLRGALQALVEPKTLRSK
jgi:tRNA C32,U32 (ribose-2'-O)-methylase TrmJ